MIEDLPSVLLLDCSEKLKSQLVRQGFDVESGEVGFSTGVRRFPKQIYEHNIIIYNPTTVVERPDGSQGYIRPFQIQDVTPNYQLSEISSHVNRGAIVLAFVKELVPDNQDAIRQAYSWIPAMPLPEATSDTKIINQVTTTSLGFLSPIVSSHFVKKPVRQKLPVGTLEGKPYIVNTLYMNLNNDPLGLIIGVGKGEVILLPDCESNDEIINTFLKRVVPKIMDTTSGTNISLIDSFKSPEEQKLSSEISSHKKQVAVLESKIESLLEKSNLAKVKKNKILSEDDTTKQILRYYDLATEQPDMALFYLYKITDTLKKKFKSEKDAIKVLGVANEWKYIGKVANASYGDMRHAPTPGEPVKEWSDQEIEKCFECARGIIYSYFKTLFGGK